MWSDPLRAQPAQFRLSTLHRGPPHANRARRPDPDARRPHRRGPRQGGGRPAAGHPASPRSRRRIPHPLRRRVSLDHPRLRLGRTGITPGQPDTQGVVARLQDTEGEGLVVHAARRRPHSVDGQDQAAARARVQARAGAPRGGALLVCAAQPPAAVGECSGAECDVCAARAGMTAQ